jgi:hypothetical protein
LTTYVIDLDGVLVKDGATFERCLATPVQAEIDRVRALKRQGHTIRIHTARSWAEWAMTVNQLAEYDIPYDNLIMGKPIADVVVDDRAVKSLAELDMDEDSRLINLHRLGTKAFLERIAPTAREPILEVGPMSRTSSMSGVFKWLPETYVDSRALFEGKQYETLDRDPTADATWLLDFEEVIGRLPRDYKSVVLMSVIEHMRHPWRAPELLDYLLTSGGRAYIVTPFNCRLHGPRPISAYFTDDGYSVLFEGPEWQIEEIGKIECPNRPLAPVGFSCIVRKK